MKYELVKVQTEHGIFFVYPNDGIGGDIINKGIWEEYFITLAKNLIEENNFVVDCGANFGFNSVIMGKIIGKFGKIFCFEPQKLVYEQLIKNLNENKIKNYQCFNSCVADVSEKLINLEPVNYDQSWVNIGDIGVGNGGEESKTISLDDLNLEKVEFIKFDIQGYELYALNGAKKTLEKFMPYIFIEIVDFQLRKYNHTPEEVINFLKKINYQIFKIVTPSWDNDYICIHDSKIENYKKIRNLLTLEQV